MSGILRNRTAQNGRFIKENGQPANIADIIEGIYKKLTNEPEPKVQPEPKLLVTIPFTEFTAGGSYTAYFDETLKRDIRKRTFILFNKMDQGLAEERVNFYDTKVSANRRTAGMNYATRVNVANNNAMQILDSGDSNLFNGPDSNYLNAPVNSFSMFFKMGTTAPIKGELQVWLTEVL